MMQSYQHHGDKRLRITLGLMSRDDTIPPQHGEKGLHITLGLMSKDDKDRSLQITLGLLSKDDTIHHNMETKVCQSF